jgi:hypothetical protein
VTIKFVSGETAQQRGIENQNINKADNKYREKYKISKTKAIIFGNPHPVLGQKHLL